MPVGLEIWNDAGVPQTIDGAYNLVMVAKGTISVGSNTAATGTEGFHTLTALAHPYMVFIRCTGSGGGALIVYTTTNGFQWFMAQSTTSFEWWAFNISSNVSNAGLQVFNADGTLRWDMGMRPLQFSSIQKPSGAAPTHLGVGSTANIWTPQTYTIPSGHPVMLGDQGYNMEIYTYGAGTVPNARFWPCLKMSGTTLTINWCRRYANIVSLPAGVTYQTNASKNPSFIFTVAEYL